MFQGTFALLQQSLRTDTRKMATHLFMLLFVATLLLMLWVAEQESMMRGAPGLEFFTSISFINLIYIVLAGLGFFTSAITEEKEDGTLGLLKMTGLSPLVLLLGKSTSRLIYALLLLSVQIPFVMLTITLGGVLLHQIIACYVALASFMILMANLGLFCSVVCRTSRNASGLMVLFLIVYFILVPFTYFTLQFVPQRPGLVWVMPVWSGIKFFWDYHIINQITSILMTGFNNSLFPAAVWCNLIGGVGFFVASWLLFEKCTTASLQATPGPARLDTLKSTSTKKNRNRSRAWSAAIAWKDFHFTVGGFTQYIMKYILYSAIYIAIFMMIYIANNFRLRLDREEVGAIFTIGAIIALAIELGLIAGRLFQEEIRWQTLSVLFMLPKSVARISYEKVFGCLWGIVPAFSFLVLGCALAPENVFEFLDNLIFDLEGFLVFLMFITGFISFLHLTTYLSLYVKWGALPVAIVVYGFFLFCCGTFFAFVMDGILRSSGGEIVAFLIWIGAFSLVSVTLHILTGEKLRELAAK